MEIKLFGEDVKDIEDYDYLEFTAYVTYVEGRKVVTLILISKNCIFVD